MFQFRHVNVLSKTRSVVALLRHFLSLKKPVSLWPHPGLTGCLTGQTVSLLFWLVLLASGEV